MILGIYIKVQALDAGNGTLNPIYKPIWEKVSSTLSTADKSLNIVLKGSAILETPITDDGVTVQYSTTVTSNLTANDILVYIDGELENPTSHVAFVHYDVGFMRIYTIIFNFLLFYFPRHSWPNVISKTSSADIVPNILPMLSALRRTCSANIS